MAPAVATTDYHLELTPGILKALGHPVRLSILRVFHRESTILSGTELAPKIRVPQNLTSYHVRVLASDEAEGALVRVSDEKVRGVREIFYRSTLEGIPLVEAYIARYAP